MSLHPTNLSPKVVDDFEKKRYAANRVLEIMNLNEEGMTAAELLIQLRAEAEAARPALEGEPK